MTWVSYITVANSLNAREAGDRRQGEWKGREGEGEERRDRERRVGGGREEKREGEGSERRGHRRREGGKGGKGRQREHSRACCGLSLYSFFTSTGSLCMGRCPLYSDISSQV